MNRVHYAIFGCLISVMLLLGSAKAVKHSPVPVEQAVADER